jgi:uncharacterized membrane protein YhhN
MSGVERDGTTDPLPTAPEAPPARAFASRAALITGVAAAGVALIARAEDAAILSRVAKPLPAVALAVWTALNARSRAARVVVYGLVASAAGDALLDVKATFIAGMAAFAAAHIAYIVAIERDRPRLQPIAALPFLMWGVVLFVCVRPGLGPLAVPVAVYSVVICAMMWRAAARYLMDRKRSALIGLLGAVLFGISDSLIAVRLGGGSFTGMHIVILTTYWLGQAGIAASFVAPLENPPRVRHAIKT